MLKRILDTIVFIAFVLFLFILGPCITMVASVLQLNLIKSHKYWSQMGCKILGIRFRKLEDSVPINQESKTMLLLNHRSWSDFFVHDICTEYTANFVSRLAVGFVFPTILLLSTLSRSIWFFKRGNRKGGLDDLFKWFDRKWEQAFRQNIVIYPEGHRMYSATKAAPLKKGLIGYAYRKGIDIQIVITFGNDKVMNEKKLQLKTDQEVVYYAGEVIKANKFQSEQEHFQYIEKAFGEYFEKVQLEYNK